MSRSRYTKLASLRTSDRRFDEKYGGRRQILAGFAAYDIADGLAEWGVKEEDVSQKGGKTISVVEVCDGCKTRRTVTVKVNDVYIADQSCWRKAA